MVSINKLAFYKIILILFSIIFMYLGIDNVYFYIPAAISLISFIYIQFLLKKEVSKIPEVENIGLIINEAFLVLSKKYSIPQSELKLLTEYKEKDRYIRFYIESSLVRQEVFKLTSRSGKLYIIKVIPTLKAKY